jgi:hypothetical protein
MLVILLSQAACKLKLEYKPLLDRKEKFCQSNGKIAINVINCSC